MIRGRDLSGHLRFHKSGNSRRGVGGKQASEGIMTVMVVVQVVIKAVVVVLVVVVAWVALEVVVAVQCGAR